MNTRTQSWEARSTGYQCGQGLLELLLAITLSLLLLAGLSHGLIAAKTWSDALAGRIGVQQQLGFLNHFWPRLVAGAGHMGCLRDADRVVNLLNTDWPDLGLLSLSPSIEIVQAPQSSAQFAAIENLAPDSQALIIRGFAESLATFDRWLSDERGEASLASSKSRINSNDVVLLSDCQQATLFSATSTWHSGGRVRFSWSEGAESFDNAATGTTVNGATAQGVLALDPAGFAAGARLFRPTGSLIYVAASRISTPQRQVFALWRKTQGGVATELLTGVARLRLRYGAWRDQNGGQVGYFDAATLPVDARVLLLLVNMQIAADYGKGDLRLRPAAFAVPLLAGAGAG
ncbi:MAG: hypothetical protein GWP70_05045 [Proteobacteria bacterium]|nr:hypothetical protein [Pseudomonadota bacterium]